MSSNLARRVCAGAEFLSSRYLLYNTVVLEMPDGGRLDLPPGASHFDKVSGNDIPTPHVHDPLPPFEPPYENIPSGLSRIPRSATNDDLTRAIEHNKSLFPYPMWGRKPPRGTPIPKHRPHETFPLCPLCPPPRKA